MIEPGQDLYHGTYHRFAGKGREVWPGHATNHPGRTMDVNAEHVYAATDLSSAYSFARNASDRYNRGIREGKPGGQATVWRAGMSPEDTGEPNGIGRPIYRPSAPRVYPVTNQGKLQPDMEQIAQGAEDDEIDAYQSKSPLSITGKDMGAEAHAEYNDQFGDDGPGQSWNTPLSMHQFRPTQVGDALPGGGRVMEGDL